MLLLVIEEVVERRAIWWEICKEGLEEDVVVVVVVGRRSESVEVKCWVLQNGVREGGWQAVRTTGLTMGLKHGVRVSSGARLSMELVGVVSA